MRRTLARVPIAPEPNRVEIRLLGPLEAVVDGLSVPIGGPQARALLSLLAVSVGTPVSLDRLIDGVWAEGDHPAGAANTVQVYVSRLRRALTADGGSPQIRSAAGGYLLDLPIDAVDLHRFERLAALGHDQLARGEAAAAEPNLAAAVAIWRGPALPDQHGDEVTALRARLDRRLVTAQAEHADALVALGHAEQAVAELESLVRLHPLDEGVVVRLMTALYHSGRQADALAAYGAATARLAEELGVDPGAQLRHVHEAVLRQSLVRRRPRRRRRTARRHRRGEPGRHGRRPGGPVVRASQRASQRAPVAGAAAQPAQRAGRPPGRDPAGPRPPGRPGRAGRDHPRAGRHRQDAARARGGR